MVLNQPALSKAAWVAEVKKMINVYKAPIDQADVEGIGFALHGWSAFSWQADLGSRDSSGDETSQLAALNSKRA